MKELGINKGVRALNWISVGVVILFMVLTVMFVIEMFGSIEDLSLMNDQTKVEEAIMNMGEEVGSIVAIGASLGLVAMLSYGLAIAGLVVSIISIVKSSKLGANKTGAILSLIGYGIYILTGIVFLGIASIVLWIIGAIMLNKTIVSDKGETKDIYVK